MVYFDRSGQRIKRPLARRTPPADPDLDEAKIRYILKVADDCPNATPDEVHAEIYYERNRHDITKAMVRHVLGKRRRTFSLWRFNR